MTDELTFTLVLWSHLSIHKSINIGHYRSSCFMIDTYRWIAKIDSSSCCAQSTKIPPTQTNHQLVQINHWTEVSYHWRSFWECNRRNLNGSWRVPIKCTNSYKSSKTIKGPNKISFKETSECDKFQTQPSIICSCLIYSMKKTKKKNSHSLTVSVKLLSLRMAIN